MDFVDQIRVLASRIATNRAMIQTEEATKTSMVMPLIQILGYNVFDPTEVTPELIADVGTKKGEKVDYAILMEGTPIMLFECKKCGADLSINHASQLFRYFHVTAARFGVLTNGIRYRFFTDLSQPNKMDEKPFFEFDILDFNDRDIVELKKFAKAAFDLETILTTANELKYTRAIQAKLAGLMASPSEDFVRLVSADLLGTKRFTPALKEQFTTITRRAFEQLVGERINDRLKGAMTPDTPTVADPVTTKPDSSTAERAKDRAGTESLVETTAEEIEGFHIVRAIVRDVAATHRVAMRDAQTYCAVLFDDNNRKPICRLRFNNTDKLRIGVFGEDKAESIHDLTTPDDIYNFAEQIREGLRNALTEV